MSVVEALRARGHPIGLVTLHRRTIDARVRELGAEIAATFPADPPILVATLKAGAVFLADLSRAIPVPHELETVQVAAWDGRPAGPGAGAGAALAKDVTHPIAGRHVVIVEDMVDTGLTLSFLVRTLRGREPASLRIAVLLDRPHRRLVDDLPIVWIGFSAPDELLCGYGLGLDERWRALPDLHVVDRAGAA